MIGGDKLERTRVTCWWSNVRSFDHWETTDPTGCRYIVSPVYPSDDALTPKWGAAWVDGPYLGLSRRLHDTKEDAMSYVELYFASHGANPSETEETPT
jgi:hypothetical protein